VPEVRIGQQVTHLAFRYGLLIAVSDRVLTLFRFAQDGWLEVQSIAIAHGPTRGVRGLAVEGGVAYLATTSGLLAVDLTYRIARSVTTAPCAGLTATRDWVLWWEDQHPELLHVMAAESGRCSDVPLPSGSGAVAAAAPGDVFAVAAGSALFTVTPEPLYVSTLEAPAAAWSHIAQRDGTVVALGSNAERAAMTLFCGSVREDRPRTRPLVGQYREGLAWSTSSILVALASQLQVYPAAAPLSQPQAIDLQQALTIQPGYMLLRAGGCEAAVMAAVEGEMWRVLQVDIASGQYSEVGAPMSGPPLPCLCDQRLVIGSRTSTGTTLATFELNSVPRQDGE
jgi:hypothetical protein